MNLPTSVVITGCDSIPIRIRSNAALRADIHSRNLTSAAE